MISKMRSAVTWLFIALLLTTKAYAANGIADRMNPVFDRLNMREGLSHSAVVSVTQDRFGFIWVGTNEGLNRYDGDSFRHFFHNAGDPTSLSHDFVYTIVETIDQDLLIGTDRGLSRYDPTTESFERIYLSADGELGQAAENQVKTIFEDRDNQLWVGTGVGAAVIENGKVLRRFHHDPSDPRSIGPGGVRAIVQDADGVLWFGTEGGGLSRYIKEKGVFERYLQSYEPNSIPDNSIRDLMIDTRGVLWIATFNGGVASMDTASGEVTRQDIGDAEADPTILRTRRLYEDSSSRIWIGSDAGVFLRDPETGAFSNYAHIDTDPGSLSDNLVTDVFEDRSGVLWFGTYNGLSKWNSRAPSFALYRVDKNTNGSLAGDSITAFTETNDSIFIGSMTGLTRYDKRTQRFDQPDYELADSRVMALNSDDEGNLWIGTMTGGVTVERADGEIVRFSAVSFDADSLASNQVSSMLTDTASRVWVGMYGAGVDMYLGDGRFEHYGREKLADVRVTALRQDESGNIWVATNGGGVSIIDPETQMVTALRSAPNDPATIGSDNLVALTNSGDGMWIGARDGGLSFYDYASGEVRRIGKEEGLSSVAAYGVLVDEQRRAWVSGGKGISVVDGDKVVEGYDKSHGLQADDFNSGASFKTRDGVFLFGGNEGFNAFNPDRVQGVATEPRIEITGFKKLNEPVLFDRPIGEVDAISLEHSDYVIELNYGAMEFAAPFRNQYKYMLEGFDPDWVDAGNNRSVTYTNLDAGLYVFRVLGTNSDGVWAKREASVSILVSPAWYATWWATSIYIVVVGALVVVAYRVNIRRQARRAEDRYRNRLAKYINSLEQASDCIAIADADGKVEYANEAFQEIYQRGVVGDDLWGVIFQNHEEARYAQDKLSRHTEYHGEVAYSMEDGGRQTHEISVAFGDNDDESTIVVIARNVTERKATQEQLQRYSNHLETLVQNRTAELQQEVEKSMEQQEALSQSLSEKELLLKEVHHRVKNNMQVISSLLSIQSNSTQDDKLASLLEESQQRIKSMALIHENLYQSADLLKIDFDDYIKTLGNSLCRSYSTPAGSAFLQADVENVELDLDKAVPVGLVINELVSNSLKHAFTEQQESAQIDVGFRQSECGTYVLTVGDNGKGLPDSFDVEKPTSMGMEIVTILSQQLNGSIRAYNEGGARFEIQFTG